MTNEDVSFKSLPNLEKGLLRKHGSAAYGPGTFGIEIEFYPTEDKSLLGRELIDYANPQDIVLAIYKDGDRDLFDSEYYSWLEDNRTRVNRNSYYRRGWDDSYGPPDLDSWDDLNPAPDKEDEEGNVTDEYQEWESNRDEARSEFANWERHFMESYQDEYINELDDNIFDFIEPRELLYALLNRFGGRYEELRKKYSAGRSIEDVTTFLSDQLGQSVGSAPDKTHWEVGMDGENVEIRSRHLTMDDFGTVEDLFSFLKEKNYDMNPDTSAHIHVGLPEDFDAFSLLALSTLVDEKAVKSSVGERNLEGWAKLRDTFEEKVVKKIEEAMDKAEISSLRFSEEKLTEFLREVTNKFTGTNISSFWRHNTVEFRYFGSNISNVRSFLAWVKYFMLLPVVAKRRKQVKFKHISFTRQGDGTVLVTR